MRSIRKDGAAGHAQGKAVKARGPAELAALWFKVEALLFQSKNVVSVQMAFATWLGQGRARLRDLNARV